jgi:hypothetical protein
MVAGSRHERPVGRRERLVLWHLSGPAITLGGIDQDGCGGTDSRLVVVRREERTVRRDWRLRRGERLAIAGRGVLWAEVIVGDGTANNQYTVIVSQHDLPMAITRRADGGDDGDGEQQSGDDNLPDRWACTPPSNCLLQEGSPWCRASLTIVNGQRGRVVIPCLGFRKPVGGGFRTIVH